jgi:hypothetical protein
MTITHDKKPASSEDETPTRRRGLVPALLIAILVLAAVLVIGLTLPLLGRSTVAFFIVAGVCWAAIFAGTFLVTRGLRRADTKSD